VEISDDLFIRSFEDGSIPIEQWTHVAHVRVSWIYLSRWPYEVAREKIKAGIKNLVRVKGLNAAGYSETLTLVYIHLIQFLRMQSSRNQNQKDESSQSWAIFQSSNPELFDRASPLPLKYYRKETILSPEAKNAFIEPDLMPLPSLS
jgi:hypothetical protein